MFLVVRGCARTRPRRLGRPHEEDPQQERLDCLRQVLGGQRPGQLGPSAPSQGRENTVEGWAWRDLYAVHQGLYGGA